MRRSAWALVVAITILGASQASAGISSGDDENDYEGTVEDINGTYFGFDLNNAKTKVSGITAYVGFECDNDDVVYTLVEADGSLSVNGSGRFNGRVLYKESPNSKVEYIVDGALKGNGKANGTLKGKYEDPFYETPCKTGRVEWKAKKGADVEVRRSR